MSSRMIFCSLFLFLLTAGSNLNADVIDSYQAIQGPFTVGPGERIADEQSVVYSDDILGGFRVSNPGVNDRASAGSTASMASGGGGFTCALRFPNDGNAYNNGGCVSVYDRDQGPLFDLSGSTMFQFEARDVSNNNPLLYVSLGDINNNVSFGTVTVSGEGQVTLPFRQLTPPVNAGGADLTLIDNITLVMSNTSSDGIDITLLEFATDGPIVAGPDFPGDDDIVAEELSGSYYNAARSGEGCQLTQERDGISFILTCYLYNQGEQFWLIGFGFLMDGQIIIPEMTVTSGADYGEAFNPADVVREKWGSATMTWGDCNNAELELTPELAGFEQYTMTLTRIVPVTCGGGGAQGDALPWMGSWFWINRDGEGFQLSVEGDDANVFVMTWYTYLDGKQVWMIGTGVRNGNQLVFSEMIITNGTGFGSAFNPDDVIREVFGSITLDFSDCNNLTATVDSQLPEFSDITLEEIKLIPGNCP